MVIGWCRGLRFTGFASWRGEGFTTTEILVPKPPKVCNIMAFRAIIMGLEAFKLVSLPTTPNSTLRSWWAILPAMLQVMCLNNQQSKCSVMYLKAPFYLLRPLHLDYGAPATLNP